MPVVVCCRASPSGPGRSHDSGVPMRSPRRSLRPAKPRTKSGDAPGGHVWPAGAGPASGVDVGFDAVFDPTAAAVAATGTVDKRGEAGAAHAVAASNDASASRWCDFTDPVRSHNVGGNRGVLAWAVAISRALVAGVLSGCRTGVWDLATRDLGRTSPV